MNPLKILGAATVLASVMLASGAVAQQAAPQQVIQKPTLSSAAAKTIGQACEAFAAKNGWRQAITVLNAKGDIIYFYRMEGTTDIGAETSPLKAKSALFTRRIGRDLAGLNQPYLLAKGLLPSPGGIPIKYGDDWVGAVGVGGGVSIHDHECAMTGLAAVGMAPKEVPPAATAAATAN